MKTFRPDVPLSRDEASRFLPSIIALMVYLTALTLAGSFTLHRAVTAGHISQTRSFSVQIPYTEGKTRAIAEKILAMVKDTPGVAEAEITDEKHIKEMVEPWLGKSAALSSLPLPAIIEAKVTESSAIDYGTLEHRLRAVAPGAQIDDHKLWVSQFSGFVRSVQWMLVCVAVMIMSSSAAAVIFACKTSLKIHRATVGLLHRLGAYDNYIANQFQYHAALLAMKGAFVGCGFAAGTVTILHLMAQHIDSPLFPTFTLSLSHWMIFLALPVLMTAIALASARLSVLATLKRMP